MLRATLVLLVLAMASPVTINGQNPSTPDGENKCGGCPCNNPCSVPPPPPPPPPPSPPPPPKKPPTPYCPPPPDTIVPTPPSQYIYITGPPGDVYPVDTNFSTAHRSSGSTTVGLIVLLIAYSFLQLALLR